MSFNLWTDHFGSRPWTGRRTAVVSLIRQYQPDLIGFQEATLDRIQYLEKELPEYAWYGVGRDDGKTGGEFNPVFYRKMFLKAGRHMTLWLSPTPSAPSLGWDASCPRIASFCEFSVPESLHPPFVFINTHLDHFGRDARHKGCRMLLNEINTWDSHRPVILLGDFNFRESSPSYREVVASSSGLKDALVLCESTPEGPNATWQGFLGAGIGRKRLDYLFVRRFHVKRHSVLTEKFAGRFPSDHFPVYGELNFSS